MNGEQQNRIIDAIERAKSSQIATGNYNHSYGLGYAHAKRDVLVEIAKEFERMEAEAHRESQRGTKPDRNVPHKLEPYTSAANWCVCGRGASHPIHEVKS